MFYFYVFELFPFVCDIFLNELKNFYIVNGYFYFFFVKNESIVFWVDFEFCATYPRSPVFIDAYLTCFSLIPQLRAIDLTSISRPMYN